MRNKFVKDKDVCKKIKKVSNSICALNSKVLELEKQIEQNHELLTYLQTLSMYLCQGGIVPVSSKLILNNDKILEYYVLPLKLQNEKEHFTPPMNFWEIPYSHLDYGLRAKFPYKYYKMYRDLMKIKNKRKCK